MQMDGQHYIGLHSLAGEYLKLVLPLLLVFYSFTPKEILKVLLLADIVPFGIFY